MQKNLNTSHKQIVCVFRNRPGKYSCRGHREEFHAKQQVEAIRVQIPQ